MKISQVLRRHTYQSLADYRVDCKRISSERVHSLVDYQHNKQHLRSAVADIAEMRLLAAYQPLFNTLTKIMGTITVIAMLSAPTEGRHVRHRSDRVHSSTHVYVPPVMEHIAQYDPFIDGAEGFDFPKLDVSYLLDFVRPQPWVPLPPSSTREVEVHEEYVEAGYNPGKGLIAAGIGVIFAAILIRVTGPIVSAAPAMYATLRRKQEVTLVETRRYLPWWVSRCWLHLKHYLRLH